MENTGNQMLYLRYDLTSPDYGRYAYFNLSEFDYNIAQNVTARVGSDLARAGRRISQ